jgi:hypothetical protein
VPELTIEQRAALQMLAETPYGLVAPVLRARGFDPMLMVDLVFSGYVNARPQSKRAGGRTFRVTRFFITDAGRHAIEGD